MDRPELKAMVTLAKQRAIGCAIALTRDKQPLLLLHRTMQPRQVLAQLRKQAGDGGLALDPTTLRFGRAKVDGASDGQCLSIAVNKPVPNEEAYGRKLRGLVKPVGCRQCRLSVDDTLNAGTEGAGEGGDAGAAGEGGAGAAAEAAPPAPAAGGVAAPGPAPVALPSPVPGQAADTPPGASPGPTAPAAAGRARLLAAVPVDVARAMQAALSADPSRKGELAGLLARVRAGMDKGGPSRRRGGGRRVAPGGGGCGAWPGTRHGTVAGRRPGAARPGRASAGERGRG